MKLFVLGVPHTITSREFSSCAFTQKVFNLCLMMHRAGHEVIHLGVEGSDPECTENVNVMSLGEWSRYYSHPGSENYNTRVDGELKPYHNAWASRVRREIESRCSTKYESIVCVTIGNETQLRAVKNLDQFQFVCESGIGYQGASAPFRVYESYACLHMDLALQNERHRPHYYWAVIPNAFDIELFDFKEKRGEDFLFLGRLNDDKGVGEAIEVCRRIGRRITIVGQGNADRFRAPHVTALPAVGVEARRVLLRECRAVFCPSHYVEPFCGVSIEAQLSGAPVICSDFGALAENVLHGITGYRCRNMDHYVWAAKNVDQICPIACREWAERNFSLFRVACMYDEYFNMVMRVRTPDTDWAVHDDDRRGLDWLRKKYPSKYHRISPQLAPGDPDYAPGVCGGYAGPPIWERSQQ